MTESNLPKVYLRPDWSRLFIASWFALVAGYAFFGFGASAWSRAMTEGERAVTYYTTWVAVIGGVGLGILMKMSPKVLVQLTEEELRRAGVFGDTVVRRSTVAGYRRVHSGWFEELIIESVRPGASRTSVTRIMLTSNVKFDDGFREWLRDAPELDQQAST